MNIYNNLLQTAKKLLREFKGLPKCDVTRLPQHLGQDQWCNQVMFRLHTPRATHWHHCHRIFDHKLSVSESGYDMFFVNGWKIRLGLFLLFFADWYDGGNGSQPRQLGQPHERGHRLAGFETEYPIVPLDNVRSWSEGGNRPITL